MPDRNLILVLGDQLTAGRGALREAVPGRDHVLMAEVAEEASYVPHNRHKIAFLFSAMRHFRDVLEHEGFTVIYHAFDEGIQSLTAALDEALSDEKYARITCCQPGEHRVLEGLSSWADKRGHTFEWVEDDRFLCSRDQFAEWTEGRKSLRMEFFYRVMRKRHGILVDDDGKPTGGKWNYDADNRSGWRGKDTPPERTAPEPDGITREVIDLVNAHFPDNPGDLTRFPYGVTAAEAEEALTFFIDQCLPLFGKYQDALADGEPWLYHSLISMYLNAGLLDPLDVCRRVESAWREQRCELAAAEGFIRQVLGWREYVRGIYWLQMPEYAQRNALAATAPLPDWFWNAETDMACLHQALAQSLDLGYAHHIQRLMVIGNFALLAGLEVKAVCAWYLAVYVDAFEWVELPNTLGMALHGDDGLMASKPYAASGKYIQRQGNHCRDCHYRPDKVTGKGACPYNSLYWAFLDRHAARFSHNPRMALALRNWERKSPDERGAILAWADAELERLL
jgi:deoxyribodipyrimidine photolyase-related protein